MVKKSTKISLLLTISLLIGVVLLVPQAVAKTYPPGVCGTPVERDPWGPNNDWTTTPDLIHCIDYYSGMYLGYWATGVITVSSFNYEIKLDGPDKFYSWLDILLGNTEYIKQNNLVVEKVTSYVPVIYIESKTWYSHQVSITTSTSNSLKMEFSLGLGVAKGGSSCSIEGGYSTTTVTTTMSSWTESVDGGHWKIVYVKMVFLRVYGTVKYFNDEIREYDALIHESSDWSNIYVTSDLWSDTKELPIISSKYYDSPNDGDTAADKFYYLGTQEWQYSDFKTTSAYFGAKVKIGYSIFSLTGGAKFTWTSTSGMTIKHKFVGPGQLPSTVSYYYLKVDNFFSLNVYPVSGGGGCPILFVFDGSDYTYEGLLDIHNPSGHDVILEHKLITEPVKVKGHYLLRLVEHPQTISHIDKVSLYGVLPNGKMRILPLSSAQHSSFGQVLDLLKYSDDIKVDILGADHNEGSSESIDLEFLTNGSHFCNFILIIEGNNVIVKT